MRRRRSPSPTASHRRAHPGRFRLWSPGAYREGLELPDGSRREEARLPRGAGRARAAVWQRGEGAGIRGGTALGYRGERLGGERRCASLSAEGQSVAHLARSQRAPELAAICARPGQLSLPARRGSAGERSAQCRSLAPQQRRCRSRATSRPGSELPAGRQIRPPGSRSAPLQPGTPPCLTSPSAAMPASESKAEIELLRISHRFLQARRRAGLRAAPRLNFSANGTGFCRLSGRGLRAAPRLNFSANRTSFCKLGGAGAW